MVNRIQSEKEAPHHVTLERSQSQKDDGETRKKKCDEEVLSK